MEDVHHCNPFVLHKGSHIMLGLHLLHHLQLLRAQKLHLLVRFAIDKNRSYLFTIWTRLGKMSHILHLLAFFFLDELR
jgi:hypothetical protein